MFDLGTTDESLYEDYSVYESLHLFGPVVLQTWAAVCGCDYTPNANGMSNIGPVTVAAAFESLKESHVVDGNAVMEVTVEEIACALHDACRRERNSQLKKFKQVWSMSLNATPKMRNIMYLMVE